MSERDKALVANAADRKQVKHAGRKERRGRDLELDDLRATLGHDYARRALWRILKYCAPLESPMHASNSFQSHAIGRGDVGRFMIAEINEADDDKWLLMQREARARERSIETENVAVRTTSAGNQPGDDDEA